MDGQALNHSLPTPGSARLSIVIPVAIASYFYQALLEYTLPLYFSALHTAAQQQGRVFPSDVWSQLMKFQIIPWIVGPILAVVAARRYGERLVWSAALLGEAIVPLVLSVEPAAGLIPFLALWQGLGAVLMWIGGISLVQMVTPEKKGLANGLMMTSIGAGSIGGPVVGRVLLYRQEVLSLLAAGDWSAAASRLFNFTPMQMTPTIPDFRFTLAILVVCTVICGLLVGFWGQFPGRFPHDPSPDWRRMRSDVGRLVRIPRFWALAIALALLGGPVFQASNQFLPYRAEDMGLKSGAQDSGWIWLQLLKPIVWLLGGAAVGCLAGRRAPGIAGVLMIGSFALAALGIGLSHAAWQLFACVTLFEFARQFMRWSHAGYLTEHLPGDLRVTAIGFAIAFSGLGSTIFGWTAASIWDPSVDSSQPFLAAAMVGGTSSLGLFVFDRFWPIRESAPSVSNRLVPTPTTSVQGD